MNVAYNSYGIPFLIAPDGEIVEFNSINARDIISELSMEPELLNEIKDKTIKNVKDKISTFLNANTRNFEEFKEAFSAFSRLGEFFIVIDICTQAEDLFYHATAEKPYASWIWDSSLRAYKAPAPPPKGVEGEIYHWDEVSGYWQPIEPAPYNSWEWDLIKHMWVPPIAYPIDAGPTEFVWDDTASTWVVNR